VALACSTFDEPVGELMNVLLIEDYQQYQLASVGERCLLVINIGSLTTNRLAVNLGGMINYDFVVLR